MNISQLRHLVQSLPARQQMTDEFETIHRGRWAGRLQQHLDGWLADYDRPGYYNRGNPGQDARHFQCAPGLLWLAEALGKNPERLHQAWEAVAAAGANPAQQRGALRAVTPWDRIEVPAHACTPLRRVPAFTRLRQRWRGPQGAPELSLVRNLWRPPPSARPC